MVYTTFVHGHDLGMVYDMVLITLTTRLVGLISNYQHKHVDKLYESSIHYPLVISQFAI